MSQQPNCARGHTCGSRRTARPGKTELADSLFYSPFSLFIFIIIFLLCIDQYDYFLKNYQWLIFNASICAGEQYPFLYLRQPRTQIQMLERLKQDFPQIPTQNQNIQQMWSESLLDFWGNVAPRQTYGRMDRQDRKHNSLADEWMDGFGWNLQEHMTRGAH